jgi:nucleoside-diphosphate-sugar epimerase
VNATAASSKTALVAGASGFIGRRITEHLLAEDWHVIGLARGPQQSNGIEWIAVDLSDRDDCQRKLGTLAAVTHVFYAARYDHPQEGTTEPVEINAAMLENLVSTVERAADVQHVHAVHGTKYYGHQLGPVPAPLYEISPRAANRNYYFLQEDFLVRGSARGHWTYTTSRPHSFCDVDIDRPRSLGLVIAVYAAIQAELGLPFDFPGGERAYQTHTQFTEVGLLARAAAWMSTESRCANQSFNVVNGDYPRWSELWPSFAAFFGLESGTPRSFSLAQYMADKSAVWQRIVAKHGLRQSGLETLVLWPYGDYQFRPEWDVMSSMSKARALGFTEAIDSTDMFMRHFARYREERVIPSAA